METTVNLTVYLQFFIGLFAIVNPFGSLPIFFSMTSHFYEADRKRTCLTTAVAIVCILLISLYLGRMILDAFSISLDSFRVAGGFILLTISMAMISGKLGEQKQNKEEKNQDLREYENIGVVPLAMPIMAGPGTVGSTIVWGTNYQSIPDYVGFSIAICVFGAICYVLFRYAAPLVKKLGKTGSNVVTRIMGLLLMAMGVEIISTGLSHLFPGLVAVSQ